MEAWWEKYESMCESWNREREERRRFWAERDAAHERYLAEQAVRHEAEREAAAVTEREAAAEREAKAAEEREAAVMVEREADAERERDVAEAEEDTAEKYEQSATVTVFVGSSKAFWFGFLNESSVLPKINVVLPQFNVVLPQFHDLGLEIVFPQISDLRFAVSPKIGNSVLSGGVLGDCGGDSAIDGAGRPPRKPPDSFFCSGDLCFLVADSWRLVLCVLIDLFQIDDQGVTEWFQLSNSRLLGDDSPQYDGDVGLGGVVLSQVEEFASGRGRRPPRQPPDFLLCGEDLCFLTGDPCTMVMARRPPAKPPDVAVGLISWWGQLDTAAWCKSCTRWRRTSHRDMEQVRGKRLDFSFPWEWAKPKLLKGVGPCCWWFLQEKKKGLEMHVCMGLDLVGY